MDEHDYCNDPRSFRTRTRNCCRRCRRKRFRAFPITTPHRNGSRDPRDRSHGAGSNFGYRSADRDGVPGHDAILVREKFTWDPVRLRNLAVGGGQTAISRPSSRLVAG